MGLLNTVTKPFKAFFHTVDNAISNFCTHIERQHLFKKPDNNNKYNKLTTEAREAGFKEVFTKAQDGALLSLWSNITDPTQPTLLFLHGRGTNLHKQSKTLVNYAKQGYNVVGIDYRGYGRSKGKPTAEGLLLDSEAAMAYIKSQDIAPQNVSVIGRSLGSGPALHLAATENIASVHLVSPYTSIKDLVKSWLGGILRPLAIFLRDDFESVENIKQTNCPIQIIHGNRDTLIPIRNAQQLEATARQAGKKNVSVTNLADQDHKIHGSTYSPIILGHLAELDIKPTTPPPEKKHPTAPPKEKTKQPNKTFTQTLESTRKTPPPSEQQR